MTNPNEKVCEPYSTDFFIDSHNQRRAVTHFYSYPPQEKEERKETVAQELYRVFAVRQRKGNKSK